MKAKREMCIRDSIGLAGLTTAEYFRDRGQDVLLFIDNIFRYCRRK